MIIEGLGFLLHALKCVMYPYPELISEGWPHMAAAIYMTFLYIAYSIIFVALWGMEQERRIKDIE